MATTSHLEITLLEQSQAQKEITINEALARIDSVMNCGAIDRDLATPPGSPVTGDLYIVAASPTGAWSGKAGQLAYFDQIWRFIPPREGLTLWVNDENIHIVYNGSTWQASGGGMSPGTYDAANIAQQLVGVSATQTLTNKTLTNPNIVGTATNDDAAVGSVGEYKTTVIPSGSAVSLTNNVANNVASLSLTAGDWDVWGFAQGTHGGTTNLTNFSIWVSATSATPPTGGDDPVQRYSYPAGSTSIYPSLCVCPKRIKLASTTTVYLSCWPNFTVSTLSAWGFIAARRAR